MVVRGMLAVRRGMLPATCGLCINEDLYLVWSCGSRNQKVDRSGRGFANGSDIRRGCGYVYTKGIYVEIDKAYLSKFLSSGMKAIP